MVTETAILVALLGLVDRIPMPNPACRISHQLRSHAIENFNAQFKAIFNCFGQVPTRGLVPIQRFILDAVFVYQLVLLHRFENSDDLRVGLKSYLQAS